MLGRDRSGRSSAGSASVTPAAGTNSSIGLPDGVFEEDLLTAWPGDDVVAEGDPGGAQPGDLGGEVGHDEVDAVPAARDRSPTVGHRPARGAGRPGQQQAQVAAGDVGERGQVRGAQGETEVGGVEVEGGLHVVDQVADVDHAVVDVGHGQVSLPGGCRWCDGLDEESDAGVQVGGHARGRRGSWLGRSPRGGGVGDAPVDRLRVAGEFRADLADLVAEGDHVVEAAAR